MGVLNTSNRAGASGQVSGGGGGGAFYNHQIEQSLRLDGSSSESIERTPSSSGNRQTWSLSAWAKRAEIGVTHFVLESGASGNQDSRLFWMVNDSNVLEVSSGNTNYGSSSAMFRDTSGWNHLFIKNSGGTNTVYLNGTSIKSSSISGNTAVNHTLKHGIFCRGDSGTSNTWNGYIAEVLLFDGTAYDPTDVAESKNGVWIPKDPSSLSFGTNGFHLKFQNSSALGDDSSGNNNDFTASGLTATNQVLDSPTFGS